MKSGGKDRRLAEKPYLILGGKPLLWHSLAAFQRSGLIREIVLVAHPSRVRACRETLLPAFRLGKVKAVVAGGKTRQESVRAGLAALSGGIDTVAVHDAARPFVDEAMIREVLRVAAKGLGATTGLPATQTIKKVDKAGTVLETPPREMLWEIQTPQAFPRALLQVAHEAAAAAGIVGTDDASLVERLGKTVMVVKGSPANFKVTHAEDLMRAEWMMNNRKGRA